MAAKQGSAHVVLWLAAIVFFYLPSAAVVIHLNRRMPLEGGLYQWAKLGFGELPGFLVAWNLWLFAILNTSETGLQVTQYFRYVAGSRGESLTGDVRFIVLVSTAIVASLVFLTIRGLSIGKWVHRAGGVLMLTTFAMLIALPWFNVARGTLAAFNPLTITMPVVSVRVCGEYAVADGRRMGWTSTGLVRATVRCGEVNGGHGTPRRLSIGT